MAYDAQEVETRWQKAWADAGAFEAEIDHSKPKFYCLAVSYTHLTLPTKRIV